MFDGSARSTIGAVTLLLKSIVWLLVGMSAAALAGFRTSSTSRRPIAMPLQPYECGDANVRTFCNSVSQWACYFSLPITKISYLLIEDPTDIEFSSGTFTHLKDTSCSTSTTTR